MVGCSSFQSRRRFAFGPGSEGSLPSEVRLTTRTETKDLIWRIPLNSKSAKINSGKRSCDSGFLGTTVTAVVLNVREPIRLVTRINYAQSRRIC